MERHPLRLSYLVTGFVFIAVAVIGLVELPSFRPVDLAWIGPGLLVLVGIALVVGTAMQRDDAASATDADLDRTPGADPTAGTAPADGPVASDAALAPGPEQSTPRS
jgi:hypothetical protein